MKTGLEHGYQKFRYAKIEWLPAFVTIELQIVLVEGCFGLLELYT
jgi:hypothetical protein